MFSRPVVSDPLWPRRLQPARFLSPWASQGKNIGVGCHALLQGNLPNPGTAPRSPTLQADSLPSEPPEKPTRLPLGRVRQTPRSTTCHAGGVCLFARTGCLLRCPSPPAHASSACPPLIRLFPTSSTDIYKLWDLAQVTWPLNLSLLICKLKIKTPILEGCAD